MRRQCFARILVGISLLVVLPISAKDSPASLEFLDGRVSVQVPSGYEQSDLLDRDSGVTLIRRGDWKSALAKALPDVEISDRSLNSWFHEDVHDYVHINAVPLEDIDEQNASARELHEFFAEAFSNKWGQYSFSYFDDITNLGWLVNYAGAFVYIGTRKLGDALILVEAMDMVEVFVLEHEQFPGDSEPVSEEELWEYFRKAGNEATVTKILNSAQLEQ